MHNEKLANDSKADGRFGGYAIVGIVFGVVVTVLSALSFKAVLTYKAPPVRILNGELIRNFEVHFDKEFPLRTASINFWTALQLSLFNEGKLGVLIGKNDWLYTNEEFHVLPRWNVALESNLDFILWVQATLKAAAVPLVVVVVPEKAHIYPEFVGSHQQASAHSIAVDKLVSVLDVKSTTVVRIDDLFKDAKKTGQLYFRTDTHWTPTGAKVAARAISDSIINSGLATKTGLDKGFATVESPPEEFRGDLLSFLPLEPMFPSMLPKPDTYVPVKTAATSTVVDGDLLGDEALPEISLVGTSYSANNRWHFVGYLSEFLNETIANYAKEGVGPLPPMAQYLMGEDFAKHKPRLVIWEIPERSLLGKVNFESLNLPQELEKKLNQLKKEG